MAKTNTFTVTGTPGNVVAITVCNEIEIGEDPSVSQWPTTDYQIYGSLTDNATQKKAGTSYTFRRPDRKPYQPGDVAGGVAVTGSSTTFFQREQP